MQSTDDLLGSPAFLSWLPGETLFSLVSRHHYFSGHVLSARTCRQFFGHERAGSQHDLPSRLAQFVARTAGCFGSVEQVSKQHTLLAYYATFVSPDETENAIAAMASNSVVHLKFRLGILTSRFRANHPLKACEVCMEEDRARFGWAYWHLDHQFPGVWTCHKHDRLLRESTLKATGVERFQWNLPAQDSFFNWRAETNRAVQSELGALTSLSRLVLDLVSPIDPRKLETGRLHEVYRAELSRRGWLTEGGNLRMPALAASYLDHVRCLRVVPELDALPSTPDDAVTQLGRLLRPPRSGTHPLRHLVLINWLFGSADVFWAAYDQALDPSAIAASGIPNRRLVDQWRQGRTTPTARRSPVGAEDVTAKGRHGGGH
ncbi:MAG: TniQ family protein [Rhodoferax sp.]|nr:TniQ family protein [Rhodoferax sp.]